MIGHSYRRLHHFQIIYGIFMNGHAILFLVERDRHVAVIPGRENHLRSGLISFFIQYRLLVVIQQAKIDTAQRLIKISLGICIDPNGICATLTDNVRAGGRDGSRFRNRCRSPFLEFSILLNAKLCRIAEGDRLTCRTKNARRVGNGYRGSIRNNKGSGSVAVVKKGRRLRIDTAVVDGLVFGKGIFENKVVIFIECLCAWIYFDFEFCLVSFKTDQSFRQKLRNLHTAVVHFRDDVVTCRIYRLVQRYAGNNYSIRTDPGTSADGFHPVKNQSLDAADIALKSLFTACVIPITALTHECDRSSGNFLVSIRDLKAGRKVCVSIFKLSFRKPHRGLTGICS